MNAGRRVTDATVLGDAKQAIHLSLTVALGWLIFALLVSPNVLAPESVFGVLLSVMPRDAWLGVFWFGGAIGLVGMGTGSRLIRLASVLVMATVHGAVAFVLLHQIPRAPPTGLFAVVAVQGYYMAWRRSREGV